MSYHLQGDYAQQDSANKSVTMTKAIKSAYTRANDDARDEEAYLRAIESRDSSFDGVFVFGVSTTGIYCRPSCPARRPHRGNIAFYATPEQAEHAGFRSCKRCKPRELGTGESQVEMVRRVCRMIEQNPEAGRTLEVLSRAAGISQFHLQRVFKRITGITPRQYAEAIRTGQFRDRVKSGSSIAGAMYGAGYGSSSRLYERASAELGMTPATYSRGGQGMKIEYTIVESRLGKLLVAATRKGLCAVSLGDTDKELESALAREYPAAAIEKNDDSLGAAVKVLLGHLEGVQPHLNLPLDVQATAFQRLVWEQLRRIPYGDTRSYADIAKSIGRPEAVRAVARAIASNRVALVVPCHRVIREDKSLGGYRWGVERKKALLKKEGATR